MILLWWTSQVILHCSLLFEGTDSCRATLIQFVNSTTELNHEQNPALFIQDVLVSFFHMLEATEKGMKNIQPLSSNEKKVVVGGTWPIASQERVLSP